MEASSPIVVRHAWEHARDPQEKVIIFTQYRDTLVAQQRGFADALMAAFPAPPQPLVSLSSQLGLAAASHDGADGPPGVLQVTEEGSTAVALMPTGAGAVLVAATGRYPLGAGRRASPGVSKRRVSS